jgi:hypothetical protein
MKRIVVAILMAVGFISAVPSMAQAADQVCYGNCASIYHLNDNGYDASFTVECSNSRIIYVPENHSSAEHCIDAVAVYVHADEKYRCINADGIWYDMARTIGWQSLNDYSRKCVVQHL